MAIDEISLMLSHIVVNENDTTSIYSPHDPTCCQLAKAAIQDIVQEVQIEMKVNRAGLGLAIADTIAKGAGARLVLHSPAPGRTDGFEAILSPGNVASTIRT